MLTETPPMPTTLRSRLTDGRLVGTDGSVWVYRAVPMSPVADAKSPTEAAEAAEPLLAAYEDLASMAPVSVPRRNLAKSGYRETHMLLVNLPKLFEPRPDHPVAEYLRRSFGHLQVDRRVLLFGVRLVDKIGGSGGVREAVDSVVETLVSGQTPMSDFDADHVRVDAALSRSGLVEAGSDVVRLANAWWNHGHYPDTPLLVHADHLHVFDSADAVRLAHTAGVQTCETWPDVPVPGQHAVTFASVQDLDLPFVHPASSAAGWVSDLVSARALVVSVRGQVEPANVTRAELRRQRKRFIDDITERRQQGKMSRAEQDEMLDMLGQVEAMYAPGNGASPTLAGASVVAGFDGQIGDINQVLYRSPAKLALMAFRQPGALAETMLCSSVRANPNLHDLPTQVVACSGAPGLSSVGDSDGAMVGFSERDRQPAMLSPVAASVGDQIPMAVVPGAVGSGKTVLMLALADQYTRMGNPVTIIDPKEQSDHSAVVEAAGGQVASLDSLSQGDGVFDPIRFSTSAHVGVELATSMLMSINPWGSEKQNMEVPLQRALAHGVEQGATCIGQALGIAERDLENLPKGLVERVTGMTQSSTMFRACVGVEPGTAGLRVAEGLTLIKVGDAHLDLPNPGEAPSSITQRISLALVRMMVFGSAMALSMRSGVVMLDEAWVFLGAGRSEVERLGRLARSQQVLPMLFTQRVTDALDAGLAGYISRGLILPVEDHTEAKAACTLFGLEATPERMARITAKATVGSASDDSQSPNWASMKALRDPRTGEVLRGSVCIYADLSGRAVPVEVTLTPEFLALASTNPEDITRRERERDAESSPSG